MTGEAGQIRSLHRACIPEHPAGAGKYIALLSAVNERRAHINLWTRIGKQYFLLKKISCALLLAVYAITNRGKKRNNQPAGLAMPLNQAKRGIIMNRSIGRIPAACLALVVGLAVAPLRVEGANCSLAKVSGTWAYTYTGTIFTPNGPLPAASVGHFAQDQAGNVSGSQTRSVAGDSGVEDIAGTVAVNKDCTATAVINVLVNGQLQRSATLALVYDSGGNHARMIFESLKLPDGTNVPVVITIDANQVSPKD